VWYLENEMTVYWYTDTASAAVSVSNTSVYFHPEVANRHLNSNPSVIYYLDI
jgi:hypothetical protein